MSNSHYVTNKKLLKEIKILRETGEVTEELGKMILLIAERYSEKGNFCGYSWKDEMIGDSVLTCVKYLHNFDPDKNEHPNPFAYISTIIHRAFLTTIKKNLTHSNIKDLCMKNLELLTPDTDPEYADFFNIRGINYSIIKGNKKKKRKKKK